MLYVKSLLGDRDRSITLWLVLYYNVLKMSIYGKPWEVAGVFVFVCSLPPHCIDLVYVLWAEYSTLFAPHPSLVDNRLLIGGKNQASRSVA